MNKESALNEIYQSAYNDELEKIAKISGRPLRNLKEFIAKNKNFAGHSSRDVEGIIRDKKIFSPMRQFFRSLFTKRKMTEMEGLGLYADASSIKNPVARKALQFISLPTQTNAMKKSIPSSEMGYGSGGVLFKAPKKYSENPLSKALGLNSDEMIMSGKVKLGDDSIFLAPKKDVRRLQNKYRNLTIIPREGFEKQFKSMVKEDLL